MAFKSGAFDFGKSGFGGNDGLVDGVDLDFEGHFGKNQKAMLLFLMEWFC